MGLFPRFNARLIPLDKLPKYYIKDGKKYETQTNKEINKNKLYPFQNFLYDLFFFYH